MVRILQSKYVQSPGSSERVLAIDAYGLSTDDKPSGYATGSVFFEVDTKTVYFYDEESETWVEQFAFPGE